MRHAPTPWNRAGLVMGQKDVPLDLQGTADAEAAARACRNLEIDALFSSSMVRCVRTAEAFERVFGLTMRLMPGLEERAWGYFEGRPKSERDQTGFHSGVEDAAVFRSRVLQACERIAEKAFSPLIITHAGVIRTAIYEDLQVQMGEVPHLTPVILRWAESAAFHR